MWNGIISDEFPSDDKQSITEYIERFPSMLTFDLIPEGMTNLGQMRALIYKLFELFIYITKKDDCDPVVVVVGDVVTQHTQNSGIAIAFKAKPNSEGNFEFSSVDFPRVPSTTILYHIMETKGEEILMSLERLMVQNHGNGRIILPRTKYNTFMDQDWLMERARKGC